MSPLHHPYRRHAPLLVLVLGLVLTALIVWRTHNTIRARQLLRFRATSEQVADAIMARVDIYIALLRSARGLLYDPSFRTPQVFSPYVAALRLDTRYRGIQGIGFAQRVEPGQRDAAAAALRAHYEVFNIWPDQVAEVAFPIVLLEPLDDRNQRALGFDMYSEATRRAAMDRAWQSGRPAASGRVTLVQETRQNPQPGFLIYLPVYTRLPPADVIPGPDAELVGFVYSPFRAGDLFAGILRGSAQHVPSVTVYDGEHVDPAQLLHETEPPGEPTPLHLVHRIVVGGRTWTLVFAGAIPAREGTTAVAWTAALGVLVSALLALLVRNLETARADSERHAGELLASAQLARNSESRKRAVLDAALDGIVTVDGRGLIVEFNPAAERMFGRNRDTALGRPAIDIIFPERVRTEYTGALQRHLASGGDELLGRRIELIAVRADATEFPLETSISRIELAGEILFTAFLRDVTERHRADQRIRELHDSLERRVQLRTAELEDANRQLESFSYSVSHDLRAPARHVLGFSDLLAKHLAPQSDATAQRLIRVITDSARRMAQLIDDLLTFARTSRQEFRRGPVNMSQLVADAVRALTPETVGRRIEWRISPLPGVEGDASLLAQVWTNLLSNAIKYTRHREVAIITLEGRRESEETVYQVRDNGTGFDMRYAHKLFGVFQRLHREEEFEGTGIGLANVARVIQRHGGRVWAEATPEVGATFSFAIPHRPVDFIGPWPTPRPTTEARGDV